MDNLGRFIILDMSQLSFSEFAKRLHEVIGEENPASFVKELFSSSVSLPSNKVNPMVTQGDDSFRKYYSGGNDISALASKVIEYLDVNDVESFLNSRIQDDYDKKRRLWDSLYPWLDTGDFDCCVESTARLFVEIVRVAASKQGKWKRKNSSTKLEVSVYTIPYDENTYEVYRCPNCGETQFDVGAEYCPGCGLPLKNYCKGVVAFSGSHWDDPPHVCKPTQKFCQKCGAPTVYYEDFHLMEEAPRK